MNKDYGAGYDKGYEKGYAVGNVEAEVKYRERIASLEAIKAEYDRTFLILREAGITREQTKKLSVAAYLLSVQRSGKIS